MTPKLAMNSTFMRPVSDPVPTTQRHTVTVRGAHPVYERRRAGTVDCAERVEPRRIAVRVPRTLTPRLPVGWKSDQLRWVAVVNGGLPALCETTRHSRGGHSVCALSLRR